jgi:signal transduction histidine kinase
MRSARVPVQASPPAARSVLITAAATWLPVSIIYFHLLSIHADWPTGAAATVAAISVGVATTLGIPVWWLTAKIRWTRQWAVLFFAAHLALAIAYSAAWLTFDIGLTHAIVADAIFRERLAAMQWELLLGLWVYGLIAGVSYAIRARRDADDQRRAAEHASALAAQAQLTALRSQLNPHFLFNTLHSLGTLARRDVTRFDDALERLGDLLRHALDGRTAGCVPLADDLAFAENYIEIERLRLGARLRVDVDVSDSALDAPVPSLTIQPLVENAILHGIDPAPGGGTIRIRASTADGMLTISVADDGVGPNGAGSRNGIGLGALRERLALTYPRFDLAAEAVAEGGYRVCLTLPVA